MRSSAIKVKGEGFPVHVKSYREYGTHLLFSFSRPYLPQPCTKSAAVRALGFERHRRYHQAIHSLYPSPQPPTTHSYCEAKGLRDQFGSNLRP